MNTSIEKLREADWDKLEKDVAMRIRLLRDLAMKGGEGEIWDKIVNDLILPNLGLLAGFCANVEVEEENEGFQNYVRAEATKGLAKGFDMEIAERGVRIVDDDGKPLSENEPNSKKTAEPDASVVCPDCGGSGFGPSNFPLYCAACAGNGVIKNEPKTGFVKPEDLNPDDLRPEANL